MNEELDDPTSIMPRATESTLEDWHEWSGSPARTPPLVGWVQVQLRDGSITEGPPSSFAWDHKGCSDDLVRYRRRLDPTGEVRADTDMNVPGYHTLAYVLHRAYNQAAKGKGHERHANGEPFDEQVMADMARRFGVGTLLGQAFKKSEESQRLPHDRAIAELLGAINYLAGAIIHMEKKHDNAR